MTRGLFGRGGGLLPGTKGRRLLREEKIHDIQGRGRET